MCGKARLNKVEINLALSAFRNDLREGRVTVYYRDSNTALRDAIAAVLNVGPEGFNTENFYPQTFKRFATLFDVPFYPATPDSPAVNVWPSQDDTATAIQNFINRRAEPWVHVTERNSVSATEADPIASLVAQNA